LPACAAVEREFGATCPLDPRVILVLGGKKDGVVWGRGEIRMRKWDPDPFAQGVTALAYRQLMPLHVTLTIPGLAGTSERRRGRTTGEINYGFPRRSGLQVVWRNPMPLARTRARIQLLELEDGMLIYVVNPPYAEVFFELIPGGNIAAAREVQYTGGTSKWG
jgi:hypothetical protein